MLSGPPQSLIEEYRSSLVPFWHPVLPSAKLVDRPVAVSLLGHDIVIARLDGELVAFENLCRHYQARLSDGEVCGQVLRCKYHGWAYGSDGLVKDIPQIADLKKFARIRVPQFLVSEHHDLVWLSLSPEPRFPIPEFPECEQKDMEGTEIGCTVWRCSLPRMIQSALDDYHFPWLHPGILGDRNKPAAPERELIRTDNALISKFTTVQPANVTNSDTQTANRESSSVDYSMMLNPPGVARLIKRNQDGGTYVVFFFACPVSHDNTTVFWRVVRNYDLGEENSRRIMEFESLIQSQDEPLVSGQRPWLCNPAPVPGVDDYLVGYHTWLKELGIPSQI